MASAIYGCVSAFSWPAINNCICVYRALRNGGQIQVLDKYFGTFTRKQAGTSLPTADANGALQNFRGGKIECCRT